MGNNRQKRLGYAAPWSVSLVLSEYPTLFSFDTATHAA